MKSQILAGGRGLGKFKSGLQGGVHICSVEEAPKLAEQMLGQVSAARRQCFAIPCHQSARAACLHCILYFRVSAQL